MNKNPEPKAKVPASSAPFSILFICGDPLKRERVAQLVSLRFPTLTVVALSSLPHKLEKHNVVVLPMDPEQLPETSLIRQPVILYGDLKLMPQAFLWGASDYLAEPWQAEELVYRALRFQQSIRVHLKGVEMEIRPGSIQTPWAEVPLTGAEHALLTSLIKARGEVVPRALLEQVVPGESHGEVSRRLDAHISRLRKKIHLCVLQSAGPTGTGIGMALTEGEKRRHSLSLSPLRCARGAGYYLITD